jgi:DNA ligase-1
LTGNAALSEIEGLMLVAPSDDDIVWACRILNKDLRSGFSVSTLNKAHPKTIETEIPCALAKPYDPDKHEIRGAWSIEAKLDGLRMVVVNGQAYTRNGRTIDSVGHILKELEPFKDEYVFDGEVMGVTNFDEDSGKIRKKGMGPNLSLRYNVFDCIWKKEWDERKTQSYNERRRYLAEALGTAAPNYTSIVPLTKLNNPTSEELFRARDKYIKMGYEGVMIKDLSSPYIFKRSDSILKLKDFTDADGRITGCFEGKGKHKGKLGGFIAKFDGVETRVGSGFSDPQRDEYWKLSEVLQGRMIEVQYQNKSESGALRFPVFIKFRPDRD